MLLAKMILTFFSKISHYVLRETPSSPAKVGREQTERFENQPVLGGAGEVYLFHLMTLLHTDPQLFSVLAPCRADMQREVKLSTCALQQSRKKATLKW